MQLGLFGGYNLINKMGIFVVYLVVAFMQTTTGFQCYKCAYSLWSKGSQTTCVDDPESLSAGDRLYCFQCYKCAYSLWSEGSQTTCVDDPESLSMGDRLYCNSTSYCVFQERYRLSDQKIVSYFRTCSGTSWGDKCDPSPSHLTCKGSCQGDFCNVNDRGDKHVEYLDSHGNYRSGNGATWIGRCWSTMTFGFFVYFSSMFM